MIPIGDQAYMPKDEVERLASQANIATKKDLLEAVERHEQEHHGRCKCGQFHQGQEKCLMGVRDKAQEVQTWLSALGAMNDDDWPHKSIEKLEEMFAITRR